MNPTPYTRRSKSKKSKKDKKDKGDGKKRSKKSKDKKDKGAKAHKKQKVTLKPILIYPIPHTPYPIRCSFITLHPYKSIS